MTTAPTSKASSPAVIAEELQAKALSLACALHQLYHEANLGNLDDPIDELVYISLTRQTHRHNAARGWPAVVRVGGPRRVATRVGLIPYGLSGRLIHFALEAAVPAARRRGVHVNLIWHGRRVCAALRPRCFECSVRRLCDLGNDEPAHAPGVVA